MKINTKTKQKISLLMAVIILMTMIPVGAFALGEFFLKSYNVDEYMVGETKTVYVPLIRLMQDETIEDLTDLGINEDLKLKEDTNVKIAFASGTSSIVTGYKYISKEEYDGANGELPDGVVPGGGLKDGEEQFGFVKFSLTGKGSVGSSAGIRVALNIKDKSPMAEIRVTLASNPGAGSGEISAPMGLEWDEVYGIASWTKVSGTEYAVEGRQDYVVVLSEVTSSGARNTIAKKEINVSSGSNFKAEVSFAENIMARKKSASYDFQVAAIGNGTANEPKGNWSAPSKLLNYKIATNEIPVATKLLWKESGGKIYPQWTDPTGSKGTGFVASITGNNPEEIRKADYYELVLYRDNKEFLPNEDKADFGEVNVIRIAKGKDNFDDKVHNIIQNYIDRYPKDAEGARFTFKVRAISGRPFTVNNSDISKVSNVIEVRNGAILIDGNTLTGRLDQATLKLTAKPGLIHVFGQTKLSISGGTTKGKVEYKILGGTGAGSINGDVLTGSRPGTLRIQATMAGGFVKDKEYNLVESNIVEVIVEIDPVNLEVKANKDGVILVIPDTKINDLIDLAPFQEHGAAVLSAGAKSKATSIAIPVRALEKLSKSSKVKGITVLLPGNMRLRLDTKSLDYIIGESKGEHIIFNTKEMKQGDKSITGAQKAYLDNEKPARIFDISISSEGRSLYTSEASNRGTIYFTVPHIAKDINAVPAMYYLDANAIPEEVYSDYNLERLELVSEFSHLSLYFVREGSPAGNVTLTFQTNGGSTLKNITGSSGQSINLASYTSTRGGYLFDGWYQDQAFTKSVSRLTLVSNTTVYAKWLPVNTYGGFSDVPYNAWYGGAIKAMLEKDIMGGVAGNKFAPNKPTTRGMIVTMLYRMEGSPDIKKSSKKFTDVKDNAYYKNAVSWASTNKIVTGYGASKFGPNDNITREQMAAILKSYGAYKKYNVSASARISQFRDFGRVSSYAFESVEWAVGEQLIGGKGNGLLDPRGKATRAEVASIFQRFLEKFV